MISAKKLATMMNCDRTDKHDKPTTAWLLIVAKPTHTYADNSLLKALRNDVSNQNEHGIH